MNKYLKAYLFIILTLTYLNSSAKVSLPHIFSNNMVFQRDMPIKIWGMAENSEKIEISFNGIVKEVTRAKHGKWTVIFPEMKFGGPFKLQIHGEDNAIIFENILIGDVWICSGQSNMEFNLSGERTAGESVKKSTNNNIRLLTIPKTIQTKEQSDTEPCEWLMCDSISAAKFSAVGYFFGKKLQEDLNVPIGLINSSWGGTDIETWTSWEASMANSDYSKYKGKSLESSLGYTMDDVKRFNNAMDNDPAMKAKWFDPATKWNNAKQMILPKAWDGKLADEDGIIWFRKEIELPADVVGLDAAIQLGAIDDEDITWVNGKKVGSINLWIANRKYKIDRGILKAGKNTIIVRIKDNSSIGGMISAADQIYLEVGEKKYDLAGKWDYMPSVLSSDFGFKTSGTGPNSFASLLYNGMIHPLVGYGIKGAIWYQGENNAGRAFHYRTLFPNMINDWRKQWGYDFPFLWVQLASFMDEENQPKDSEWAELREAQNMTLSLPKTGQAVITDIGEAFDIHPRNKKDVGLRLAHTVLNVAYEKDVLPSGPVFDKMEKSGTKLIVSFTHTGNGITTSDKNKYGYVNGFAIAGADQKFVWAQAYINGNSVVVSSDQVSDPVAIRYGWANNPREINLVNSDGLLASPFRTDSWVGLTQKPGK